MREQEPPPAHPPYRRSLGVPIVLQIVAMIGLGAFVIPFAADWFSTLGHSAVRSGYVRAVAHLSDTTLASGTAAAREYNENLPEAALLDPFLQAGGGAHGTDADTASAYAAYEGLLSVSGTDAIAEVVYPRLNIGLPLYHGTGDTAIRQGVGHLFGSSLPVGGPSTHAVLTSHSGQVHAELFTKLPQARIGDVFQVRVLGETLYYSVDGLETVEPYVTDSLRIVAGEDRVTLFTCTPIGVNSHRFLVHGVRIPAPESAGERAVEGDGIVAGFPWWLLVWFAGSGAVGYLLFAPPRRRATRRVSRAR